MSNPVITPGEIDKGQHLCINSVIEEFENTPIEQAYRNGYGHPFLVKAINLPFLACLGCDDSPVIVDTRSVILQEVSSDYWNMFVRALKNPVKRPTNTKDKEQNHDEEQSQTA